MRRYGLFVSVVLLCASSVVAESDGGIGVVDLGGNQYRVEFVVAPGAGTRSVHVAGTFNSWNPNANALEGPDESGFFRTALVLPKGRHEYKFVIDGERWVSDPTNPKRSGGYGNSVLYLGTEPDAQDGTSQSKPVHMAGEVTHPAAVIELTKQLQAAPQNDAAKVSAKWFEEHPMPYYAGEAISFVYADDAAVSVSLMIAAHGARTGYALRRIAPDRGVFAISLRGADIPERSAYGYEVTQEGRTASVLDPHAWSVTSRAGEPMGRVIEASERVGRLEVIPQLGSSSSAVPPRDVYVYLPPDYDASGERRYPVLYMHDGQNCWDDPVEPFGHGGWCVNLVADRMIAAGAIAPFIGVGVANTPDRLREYGPGEDILTAESHGYIRYLVDAVKPEIDRRYRTLTGADHTALMGSSMGGVISLQAAVLRPDVFGEAACLSSAFLFEDASGRDYFDLIRARGKQPVRLYLDSGTAGEHQDGAPKTRAMVALLKEQGWQDGVDLEHFEDVGAAHNERAWRGRLERPLTFLFGKASGRQGS